MDRESVRSALVSKKTLLSFALAIVALLALSRSIDFGATADIIGGASPAYIALAAAVYYASVPVRGARWKALMDNAGIKGRLKDITEIWFIAYFVNCLVPAKLGDIYRGHMAKRKYGTTISKVVGTIVVERVLDVAALMALITVSGYLAFAGIVPGEIMTYIKYGYGILAIGVMAIIFFVLKKDGIAKRMPEKFGKIIHELERGISGSFNRQRVWISILTVAGWGLEIGRTYAVMLALGLGIPVHIVVFAALMESLLSSLPITPAGLGAVEIAVAGFIAVAGYGAEAGAALVIADRMINYASFLLTGYVVYIRSELTG